MSHYETDDVEKLKARIVNLCLGCMLFGAAIGYLLGINQ